MFTTTNPPLDLLFSRNLAYRQPANILSFITMGAIFSCFECAERNDAVATTSSAAASAAATTSSVPASGMYARIFPRSMLTSERQSTRKGVRRGHSPWHAARAPRDGLRLRLRTRGHHLDLATLVNQGVAGAEPSPICENLSARRPLPPDGQPSNLQRTRRPARPRHRQNQPRRLRF